MAGWKACPTAWAVENLERLVKRVSDPSGSPRPVSGRAGGEGQFDVQIGDAFCRVSSCSSPSSPALLPHKAGGEGSWSLRGTENCSSTAVLHAQWIFISPPPECGPADCSVLCYTGVPGTNHFGRVVKATLNRRSTDTESYRGLSRPRPARRLLVPRRLGRNSRALGSVCSTERETPPDKPAASYYDAKLLHSAKVLRIVNKE